MAYPLTNPALVPVVAAGHPLARVDRRLDRADLEAHVQLVLSNSHGAQGPSHGVLGGRVWRFVDLGRRLDFLLAGFGWCKMPPFLVNSNLESGRLVRLDIADEGLSPTGTLPIYAAHVRDRALGLAGDWLLQDLRDRLMT